MTMRSSGGLNILGGLVDNETWQTEWRENDFYSHTNPFIKQSKV